MRKFVVCLCIVLGPCFVWAEAPRVPRTVNFAGLTLKLNEKARSKIQAEVNALTKHPKYFQIKVDRLQMYFPIIERIFKEEGLPDDFKYLCLQESALISDAVSSSKAVGYWQFKKAAAEEVGLRIDRNVDERKNIVSSTRGAAKYLKKNNRLYFDNWLHALLAYHQGPGGAMKLVGNKYRGARTMPVTGRTHWYVIKFLAHKIAFEGVQSAPPKLFLTEYYEGQQKTIKQIAHSNRLSYDLVMEYNKWLKRGRIPADKPYAVILPHTSPPEGLVADRRNKVTGEPKGKQTVLRTSHGSSSSKRFHTQQDKYPKIYGARATGNDSERAKVNGISSIIVGGGDNLEDISKTTGVTVKRLLYYNDVPRKRALKQGEIWYLKPKKSKAKAEYHVVQEGEELWDISQKYGIKLAKLKAKNRIGKRQQVKAGRVLWLRFIRPSDEPVAYQSSDLPGAVPEAVASTQSIISRPQDESVTIQKTSSADTIRPRQAPHKDPEVAQASPPQLQAVPDILPEEEEFELEEPVNFVGVDKSENVKKGTQKVHVVQPGETLYAIAQRYQLTVAELQELNSLKGSSDLSIGQKLQISPLKVSALQNNENSQLSDNEYVIYEVQPGETLYQIARDNQATIKELMEWNDKSDFAISVGEQLKIKKQPDKK